jgi:hypothetical protein
MKEVKEGKIKKVVKCIEKIPLTNIDIKKYFSNADIYKYDDLRYTQDLDELFKNNNYFFILYLVGEQNYGHWCLFIKINENVVEFFSSYGDKCDSQLKYNSKELNQKLKQQPYLTQLVKKSKYKLVNNKKKFQKEDTSGDVSTCGRHCCFRLKAFLNNNMNINTYCKFMEILKEKMIMDYDKIVSLLINKIDQEFYKSVS